MLLNHLRNRQKMALARQEPSGRTEDADANCRLRHALNDDCLAEIFNYLDCQDLLTLGEMNDHYKCIINDLVIPMCKVKIITMQSSYNNAIIHAILNRHGTKIKRFQFVCGLGECHDLLKKIIERCDKDQLKCAEFYLNVDHMDYMEQMQTIPIDLSIDAFRKLETLLIRKLMIKSNPRPIIIIISTGYEALRALSLHDVQVPSDFDWTTLMNLTELELVRVKFGNEQRFIDLIHQRPKLERFVHMNTFQIIGAITFENIGKEMTKYCGDYMRSFHDFEDWSSKFNSVRKYKFLAEFKRLKELSMSSKRLCSCNVLEPLALLAANDTLEKLSIVLTSDKSGLCDCLLHQKENQMKVKQFSRLKTIHVHNLCHYWLNPNQPAELRSALNFFTALSIQLLSNAETFILSGDLDLFHTPEDIEFLENALKLRTLSIYNVKSYGTTQTEIPRIFSIIRNILRTRNDGRDGDESSVDFIEIIVNADQWKCFQNIENIEKYIKFRIKNADARELPISDYNYDAGII